MNEEEKLAAVNAYLKAEQQHVKDNGLEAMQIDIMRTYNEAINGKQCSEKEIASQDTQLKISSWQGCKEES